MNKQEAIQAMKNGKKVTHVYFSPDEWMASSSNGRQIILDDGVKVFAGEFWHFRNGKSWEDGYSEWVNNGQEVQGSDTTKMPKEQRPD